MVKLERLPGGEAKRSARSALRELIEIQGAAGGLDGDTIPASLSPMETGNQPGPLPAEAAPSPSSHQAPSTAEHGSSVALGIERIGLVPLRFPAISAIVLILLAIFSAFGLQRIQVDDSLSQLFRSDTDEFRQYEEVTRRFPSSEFDVLVVVEGQRLLARITRRSAAALKLAAGVPVFAVIKSVALEGGERR